MRSYLINRDFVHRQQLKYIGYFHFGFDFFALLIGIYDPNPEILDQYQKTVILFAK